MPKYNVWISLFAKDLLDKILSAAQAPPKTARATHLHAVRVDLNPSRSKSLSAGLDISRQLCATVVIENTSGKGGVVLTPEDFELFVSGDWMYTAQRHFSTPFEAPGPCQVNHASSVRCVVLPSGEPVLKISTNDGLFVFLGAITYNTLIKKSGYILPRLRELVSISQDGRLKDWICKVLFDLSEQRSTIKVHDMYAFVERNAETCIYKMGVDEPFKRILLELFILYSDIFVKHLWMV